MNKKAVQIFSGTVAAMIVGVNVFSIAAYAASPIVQVTNSELPDATKTVVTNLQIINLEQPKAGQLLDSYATVKSAEGLFWNIPIIWLDENGQVATVCIKGNKYTPVFAFYVPENIEVHGIDGSLNYSIKLPEYLEKVFGEKSFLSIVNPSTRITYITTLEITNIAGLNSNNSVLEKSDQTRISYIADKDNVFDFSEYEKKLNENIRRSFENESDFSQDNRDNNISEHVEKRAQEQGHTQENEHVQEDEHTQESEHAQEDEHTQENEHSQENEHTQEHDTPAENVVDLVALHCSSNVINLIGKDKLNSFLDLFINVVEPQAVYQLSQSFYSYSSGIANKSIGENIGLYVYDSRVDKEADNSKNTEGALAFVATNNNVEDYGYYIGINLETLYKQNESGEYVFDENEVDTFNNTVVHEMMHAYMDDYTRTGMAGYYVSNQYENTNQFPTWFIEGSATSVENVYEYRNYIFEDMRTYKDDNQESVVNDTFTAEYLKDFYITYNDKDAGKPSINSTDKNYESKKNTASAYVSGYLACLYLSKLAYEHENEGKYVTVTDTNNTYTIDSSAIRSGFDNILTWLHDGTSLDSIISSISDNKYQDTVSFQNAFLTQVGGTDDPSVDFCVDFLNYMKVISDNLTGDSETKIYANGSILMPFDTTEKSVIKSELPSDMSEQNAFKIVDSDTYVLSTVSNDVAYQTAGTNETGNGSSADTDPAGSEDGELVAKDNAEDGDEACGEVSIEDEATTGISIEDETTAGISIEDEVAVSTSTEDDSTIETSIEDGAAIDISIEDEATAETSVDEVVEKSVDEIENQIEIVGGADALTSEDAIVATLTEGSGDLEKEEAPVCQEEEPSSESETDATDDNEIDLYDAKIEE